MHLPPPPKKKKKKPNNLGPRFTNTRAGCLAFLWVTCKNPFLKNSKKKKYIYIYIYFKLKQKHFLVIKVLKEITIFFF